MRAREAIALTLGALSLLPAGAAAQDATISQDAQLQLELRRKRMIVHPAPSIDDAARDAADVTRQLQERRREEVIKGSTTVRPPMPSNDYDVRSAIQAESVRRALGR